MVKMQERQWRIEAILAGTKTASRYSDPWLDDKGRKEAADWLLHAPELQTVSIDKLCELARGTYLERDCELAAAMLTDVRLHVVPQAVPLNMVPRSRLPAKDIEKFKERLYLKPIHELDAILGWGLATWVPEPSKEPPRRRPIIDMLLANAFLPEAPYVALRGVHEYCTEALRHSWAKVCDMKAWYQSWYGATVPAGGMGMMHMGSMTGDLAELKASSDTEFDREFILQMIPHHEMAVMMASMLQSSTERPEMKQLADNIVASQSQEIEMMRSWLKTWYGQ